MILNFLQLDTKEYLSKSCSLLPSKRDVDEVSDFQDTKPNNPSLL